MTYKVLHYSDLDDLIDENDTYSGTIEDGLNAMEKSGYSLVHIIPEQQMPNNTSRSAMYVFHKHEDEKREPSGFASFS